MYSLSVCMSHIFHFMNIRKMKLRWNKRCRPYVWDENPSCSPGGELDFNTQEFKGTDYFISRVSCYF